MDCAAFDHARVFEDIVFDANFLESFDSPTTEYQINRSPLRYNFLPQIPITLKDGNRITPLPQKKRKQSANEPTPTDNMIVMLDIGWPHFVCLFMIFY